MPKPRRPVATDLRAASRLLVAATTGTTTVVEQMHRNIAGGPAGIFEPFTWPVQQVSGLVYASVRGATRAVGHAIDQALGLLAPLLPETEPGPQRIAAIAALNGVIGDLLAQTGNPLAQPMELRQPDARSSRARVVVLVHGSAMSDLQWTRRGHDHGAALERDLGYSAVYVRYNSGLHVSTNGRQLAAELEQLLEVWPVEVEELVLLGFSMGGLVARSACHYAELAGRRWRDRLGALVCLGAPHQGAPLERAGNLLDMALEVSRYSAPIAKLGKLRSAGVTDLRYGNVLDEHWQGRDRFQWGACPNAPLSLPRGVRCYAIAATQSKGPAKKLRSDGLVPVASALGPGFPKEHQRVVYGAAHLDLLSRPEVYEALVGWLSPGVTHRKRGS